MKALSYEELQSLREMVRLDAKEDKPEAMKTFSAAIVLNIMESYEQEIVNIRGNLMQQIIDMLEAELEKVEKEEIVADAGPYRSGKKISLTNMISIFKTLKGG